MDLHSIDLLPDFPNAGEVAAYLRLKQDKVLELHRSGVLPGYRGRGTVQFDRGLVGDFVQRLEHLAAVEPVGTPLDAVLAAAPPAAAAGRAGASRSRVRHHAGQLARGVDVSQDLFSLEEVAVLLRASPRMVLERARDGRLAGFKVGRTWIFPTYAVARMLGAPDPVRRHLAWRGGGSPSLRSLLGYRARRAASSGPSGPSIHSPSRPKTARITDCDKASTGASSATIRP